MKLKLLTILAAAFTLFFSSCSTEETQQKNENANLLVETEITRGGGNLDCTNIPCSGLYAYNFSDNRTYFITYSSSLTLAQVECKRQMYFNCYENMLELTMYNDQPADPYQDIWGTRGSKPHTNLDVSICNDPETGGAHCD